MLLSGSVIEIGIRIGNLLTVDSICKFWAMNALVHILFCALKYL